MVGVKRWFLMLTVVLGLFGCVGVPPYRGCESCAPNREVLSELVSLNFIEYNEIGLPASQIQVDSAIHDALTSADSEGGAVFVVYVHGWFHNSSPDDSNVDFFKSQLLRMSKSAGAAGRRVVGFYIGWRGKSQRGILNYLTFWGRKARSEEIARSGVQALLANLESIYSTRNRAHRDKVKMLTVGHSFGAQIVFAATAPYVLKALSDSLYAPSESLRSFGDLVVLINPAFEVAQYDSLDYLARASGYSRSSNVPLLVVATSYNDYATRYLFRVGRHLNSLFVDESGCAGRFGECFRLYRNTPGHYSHYRTHRLQRTMGRGGFDCGDDRIGGVGKDELLGSNLRFCGIELVRFVDGDFDSEDRPGLDRIDVGERYLPVWNVWVMDKIIDGHSDLNELIFVDFMTAIWFSGN